MRCRWREVLRGVVLYLTGEEQVQGEARISVYIVCYMSYAGSTVTCCQCRDGHDRLWLCLHG